MEIRNNRRIAFAAVFVCMFICSVSWMYLRIPMYHEKLHGVTYANWLLSGYIIAEVSMVIIAGTILDRIGAKNTMLIGASLFTGAALGTVLSESIDMIIAYRIIQGCGAGFMFTVAIGFIPKIFPKSKRKLPHELMTLAFATGSIFGTMIGSYFFRELHDWKIFVVGCAIATVICGIIAYISLPDVKRTFIRDVPGMVLTLGLVASVMTFSQMLNNNFELISYESLAFILFCIILAMLLIYVEKRADDPVIPRSLNKTEVGLMTGMFVVGFCGIGMLQYLAMFFIATYRFTLYEASGMMFFLILGGAITSIVGCKILKSTGIRTMAIVGPILVFIGFVAGAFLLPRGPAGGAAMLFVLGLGFGSIVTEMAIAIQSITPVKDSGTSTSMLMSMRFMGIILGMAVYGAIIRAPLKEYIMEVEGKAVEDVFEWVFNHFFECMDELLSIFQNTIVQCCTIAAVAGAFALVIIYFMVGKEDLDAPEFNNE